MGWGGDMTDPKSPDPTPSAIYAGLVAYTNEFKRIFGKDARINGRCFLVAARAFNEAMAETEEDAEVIE